VVLPDTQYYSAYYPYLFTQQTQWIVDTKDEPLGVAAHKSGERSSNTEETTEEHS
jgi:hypothetical protein